MRQMSGLHLASCCNILHSWLWCLHEGFDSETFLQGFLDHSLVPQIALHSRLCLWYASRRKITEHKNSVQHKPLLCMRDGKKWRCIWRFVGCLVHLALLKWLSGRKEGSTG